MVDPVTRLNGEVHSVTRLYGEVDPVTLLYGEVDSVTRLYGEVYTCRCAEIVEDVDPDALLVSQLRGARTEHEVRDQWRVRRLQVVGGTVRSDRVHLWSSTVHITVPVSRPSNRVYLWSSTVQIRVQVYTCSPVQYRLGYRCTPVVKYSTD